jgi:flagellar biosynthetic protein FliQ
MVGSKSQTSINSLRTSYQLPVTSYQLPVTSYQLPVTSYQLPFTYSACLMNTLNVVEICQDLLITAMWLSGPPIIVSLVVGLIISLAQTITSVQEQTLSFAPRIVAVGLVMLLMMPWMLQQTTSFTMRMMERLLQVTQ